MALKLDDFLTKKKEPAQILDLSKASVNSQEELKKMMEKVPEYKIKMDKIIPEELRAYEKKSTIKSRNEDATVSSARSTAVTFPFANPIPYDMRSLRLEDLCSVNIQWKMLTSLRPKIKSDEDYFSKLVELGKLHLHARQKERRSKSSALYERKSKNKAGITEMKIVSCRECGEEFCLSEICRVFGYDSYERFVTLDEKQLGRQQQTDTVATDKSTKNPKKTASKKRAASVKKRSSKRKPTHTPTRTSRAKSNRSADTTATLASRTVLKSSNTAGDRLANTAAATAAAVAGSRPNATSRKKSNRRVKSKIK